MSKKDRSKKKGLSKVALQDSINLHKQKALQGFMLLWYRKYDAVEKDVVHNEIYRILKERVDEDVINNLNPTEVYEYIKGILDNIQYDTINCIREDKLLSVYESDKAVWKFRGDQIRKNKHFMKSNSTNTGVDFLVVKNVRSIWIDIRISKFIISVGYVFSWEIDAETISTALKNDWNDLTDSIPLSKVKDSSVFIKPIKSLGIKIKETNEFTGNKQSYVTKTIPQETSVVIIDL